MKTRIRTKHHNAQTTASNHERGYVSLLAVFTIAILMFSLLLFAYERAIDSQAVQADVQAQTDYREKEETILRSIVAITPNRAIRAMQNGQFDYLDPIANPASFRNIFADAVAQSDARQSIADPLRTQLNIPNSFSGNTGDSALNNLDLIFQPAVASQALALVTGGLNRNFGAGFPPTLDSNLTLITDDQFPIISHAKVYGNRANGRVTLPTTVYEDFNLIPYPDINFGYSEPGQDFVAKRNWWAFSMNLAQSDNDITNLARFRRDFVLSIYEIPSQLPISASSYMALGEHADGTAWQNVTISGNVFAGKARMDGNAALPTLATRRGADLSPDSTIGGMTFAENPFAPGFRENLRVNDPDSMIRGDLLPVSLSSESGRVAFVPINRGAAYFDRFAHGNRANTVSPTSWDDYSVGAKQCAMSLDITDCVSGIDPTPTRLDFWYLRNGVRTRQEISLTSPALGLEKGFVKCAVENQTVFFENPVDLAYGKNGQFFFKRSVSGSVRFDNETFGDPIVGTFKDGYFKENSKFEVKTLPESGQICIAIYPELLEEYLQDLGGDGLDVNNSISVNVNYDVTIGGSSRLTQPSIPCTDQDYGVILEQCEDLSSFTNGFSIVTNLRLYIGDDFNLVPIAPPAGYIPPSGDFFPPCSIFSPERRYGVLFTPTAVELSGQIGSVASENLADPIRPLDAKGVTGAAIDSNRITTNLSSIRHPAELPPIFMMNWLVVLEEKTP